MKNLRFFVNSCPSGNGLSYKVKKNWPSGQFQRMLRILSWRLTTLWRNFLYYKKKTQFRICAFLLFHMQVFTNAGEDMQIFTHPW